METINNNGVNEPVSYMVYESSLARMERQVKRLFILCIVIFAALIVTNGCWIWYENQFQDTLTTVSQDVETGDGDATVIGMGDYYGESKTDSNEKDTE